MERLRRIIKLRPRASDDAKVEVPSSTSSTDRKRSREDEEEEDRATRSRSVEDLRTVILCPSHLVVDKTLADDVLEGEAALIVMGAIREDIRKACFAEGPSCTKLCNGLIDAYVFDMTLSNLIIVLYDSDGSVIGFLRALSSYDSTWGEGSVREGVWYIQVLCAHTDEFKGVGTYLLALGETIATQNKAHTMTLSAVPSSVYFYLSRGYSFIKRQRDVLLSALQVSEIAFKDFPIKPGSFAVVVNDTRDGYVPLPRRTSSMRMLSEFDDTQKAMLPFKSQSTICERMPLSQDVYFWIQLKNDEGEVVAFVAVYKGELKKIDISDEDRELIKATSVESMTKEMRKHRARAIQKSEEIKRIQLNLFRLFFSFSTSSIPLEQFKNLVYEASEILYYFGKNFQNDTNRFNVMLDGLDDFQYFATHSLIERRAFHIADPFDALHHLQKDIKPTDKSEIDSMKEEAASTRPKSSTLSKESEKEDSPSKVVSEESRDG